MSLNESIVEDAALEWFGEQFRCAPSLTPALSHGEREKRKGIRRLSLAIPEEAREEALRKVQRVGTPSLTQTNRAFAFGDLRCAPVCRMLSDGVLNFQPDILT